MYKSSDVRADPFSLSLEKRCSTKSEESEISAERNSHGQSGLVVGDEGHRSKGSAPLKTKVSKDF